ncbi:hypothetical protein MHU86_24151 [Fragilaria crotonensis]|nr:hypothetical protein MHU86_24151 [Fragilaria crotonensis]
MTLDEAFAAIADDVGISSAEASRSPGRRDQRLQRARPQGHAMDRAHRWANGARFSFNCYRHSAQLLLRRRGTIARSSSRERVTQATPLSMVLYGLALTPLAETIRARVPTVAQPWYADDAAMAGSVDGIAEAQRLLLDLGRAGLLPRAGQVDPHRPARDPPALVSLAEFNFRHEEGHRYLGGFVGSGAAEAWVDPKSSNGSRGLPRGSGEVPTDRLRRPVAVTPGGVAVPPARDARHRASLRTAGGCHRDCLLAGSPDTQSRRLPNSAPPCSPDATGRLGHPGPDDHRRVLLRGVEGEYDPPPGSLVTGDRLCATGTDATLQGRLAAKASRSRVTRAACRDPRGSRPEKRRIIRSAATGAWLSTLPSLLNGSDLSAEFRDGVRLRSA